MHKGYQLKLQLKIKKSIDGFYRESTLFIFFFFYLVICFL
jgi:hypothetical protein